MAYKRRMLIIPNARLAQANSAMELAGFGQSFFTMSCNPSGRLQNPATHWAADVQVLDLKMERLLTVLEAIPGINLKKHNEGKAGQDANRTDRALEKEGLKRRA